MKYEKIIETLQLKPHPKERGFFVETMRKVIERPLMEHYPEFSGEDY